MRDISGRVIGEKRQNPTTKPVIKKPLTNTSARPKSTGYRPLDNKVKGGFERAIDKIHQLGKTKAELTEKSAKMAVSFEKVLEFLKKYSKSIKA